MIKINGKKICIRDWTLEDLESYEYWRQSGHKWQDFDGPYYPKQTKEEISQHIKVLKNKIEKAEFPSTRQRLVIADLESNKLIGMVSWYWQGKETNWISVGIAIFDSEYWGKGIGYEAMGLWSDYLFNNMPEIARLDLRTWSGNKGMMALAEKLGYLMEACFRKARIVNGKYYDSIGFGVLREEWKHMYRDGFAEHLKRK